LGQAPENHRGGESAREGKMNTQPRGSILLVSMVFISILLMVSLTFSTRIHDTNSAMEREIASARALELAQGASMTNLQQLWADFVAQAQVKVNPQDRVVWLAVTSNDANANRQKDGGEPSPMAEDAKYNQDWRIFGQGEIKTSCKIYGAVPADRSYADLELISTARVAPDIFNRTGQPEEKNRWMYRAVRQVVRFNFTQPSKTFDFAYFANNYGWMYDNGSSVIRIYGNMGANGDLGFSGAPIIDGFLYAALNASITATGVVNGQAALRKDTLPVYRAGAGLPAAETSLLMPGNPGYTEDVNNNGVLNAGEDSNGDGKINSIEYPAGYDGNQTLYTKQTPLDMPYLGDLTHYKDMAVANTGAITQLRKGGNVNNPADWEPVVNGVYGSDASHAGLYSTYNAGTNTVTRTAIPAASKLETDPAKQERNGNVALIGTDAQPIKITGPVVVTNDLVIKGKITGQGTIYTGRNLHVVGDVTYVNPPTWNLNDPSFKTRETANAGKDMVGFASKGSVILGEYFRMARTGKTAAAGMYDNSDSWGTTATYFKTGFQNAKVQAYQADPSDQAIGYYNPVTKSFAGNYMVADGGKRYDAANLSTTIARNYYESSFSDDYIKSLTGGLRPSKIQGIFYTNHLYGGRPTNYTHLGTMVSRDEGIVFTGTCHFFYDPRASSSSTGSRVQIFLPAASGYNVWLWQETMGTP
jgi:hypothetical protein